MLGSENENFFVFNGVASFYNWYCFCLLSARQSIRDRGGNAGKKEIENFSYILRYILYGRLHYYVSSLLTKQNVQTITLILNFMLSWVCQRRSTLAYSLVLNLEIKLRNIRRFMASFFLYVGDKIRHFTNFVWINWWRKFQYPSGE